MISKLVYQLPDPVRGFLVRNRAAWWLRHQLKKTAIAKMAPPLDGYRMRLPVDYTRTYGVTPVEPGVAEFMRRTVQPGWNVVDAGAFAGYYTLLLSRLVGPHGTVHAFEPIPENNELLQFNTDLNKCSNARVNKVALGSRDSVTSFRRSHDLYSPYGSLILKNDNSRYESIEVKVRSLDSYLQELMWPVISLVKVDVEAAEAEIAEGMTETIRRFRPVLVIEIHDRPVHDQQRARRVLPILFDSGYQIFCLEDDPDLSRPLRSPADWSGEKHCIAFHRHP